MKVFFASSPRGDDRLQKAVKQILQEIDKLGYSLLDQDSSSIDYDEFVKKMSKGETAYQEYSQQKMNAMKAADICVFEASTHSTGLGYAVKEALAEGKPTIVLYYKDVEIPYFIAGVQDDKLIVRSYDEKNFIDVLRSAFSLARERRDKRFNFFISPKLLEYLEATSKKDGITKSKFIRNLIIDHMKK